MKSLILFFILASTSKFVFSQSRFSNQELSINGFRNPSIGLEYRTGQFSLHAGYYITALEAGDTYSFLKTGLLSGPFLSIINQSLLPCMPGYPIYGEITLNIKTKMPWVWKPGSAG